MRAGRRRAVVDRDADVTRFVVRVRRAKRGREREVPLSRYALEALRAWAAVRPACSCEELFVSVPRTTREGPGPLSARSIGKVVAKYGKAARLPEELRHPHVLRHTFCTLLAEREVGLEVIADLAGHADLRTTRLYVTVSDKRRERAIADTFEYGRSALARAA